MGLAGVELIMDCEDEFGVRIPDNEASRCVTVGDLLRTIVSRQCPEPAPAGCDSAKVFYSIRRGLCMCGVAKAAVRSRRTLAEILPPGPEGRRAYLAIGERAGVAMPRLLMVRHGHFIRAAILLACGGITVALAVIAWPILGTSSVIVAGVFGVFTLTSAWLMIDNKLRVVLPEPGVTLGEIVRRHVADRESWKLGEQETDIFQRLRILVSQGLGVPVGDVRLESRFVDDLGMD